MRSVPVTRYTPNRASDGEGTVESLGTGIVIWVDVELHKRPASVVVNVDDELSIGNLLVVPVH